MPARGFHSGWASSAGLPSKTILPSWMNSTRSATGSTSWKNVGRDQHGLRLAQVADQLADDPNLVGVEPAGGLVHDQHFGVVQQRLRHRDALAIPLGQLADRLVRDRFQCTLADHGVDALVEQAAGNPARFAEKAEQARSGSCRGRAGRFRAGSPGARPPRCGRSGRRCRRSWPSRASGPQTRSRAASSSSCPHRWARGRPRPRPCGIENVTSRTARNDPNCLQSPSASIMTGFDIRLRSSAS